MYLSMAYIQPVILKEYLQRQKNLGNKKLDPLFHVFIYFMSPHVSSGIPSSHLHRLIIPDDVLIQFDLLMMGAVTLETCGDMK
jgi:hypothetical protein